MAQQVPQLAPEVLQQLHHFADMTPRDLQQIADQVQVHNASRGAIILPLGSTAETTLWLLDGEVEMLADDGQLTRLAAHDPASKKPIGRLRPSRYQVKAVSNIQYLVIDNDILDDYLSFEGGSSLLVDDSYMVAESAFYADTDSEDQLMAHVMDQLNHGHLVVPSLAVVAEKVGRAVLAAGQDTRRLTHALMVDPALAAKAIKAVNHHLSPSQSPVTTCGEAVERLGAEKVISLVVNCALRETMRNPHPAIEKRMQAWWERSLRVSAISFVLARLSERFNPDIAALAGLLHRIGEAVLLHYANELPEIDEAALDAAIASNSREVSRIVMSMWNLSPDLVHCAETAGDLMREHQHAADYSDIVLVAERHADIGSAAGNLAPTPDKMPAFNRLGLGDVSPEFSLKIVDAANGALAKADALLAA